MLGPEWEHCIILNRDDWPEIQEWCVANIGEFDQDWYKMGIDPMAHIFGDQRTSWFFKRKADAILFALRWR
jgi:hypothetical protein